MKQDRFLTGILIGIAVLIVAALAVFFTRKDNLAYVSDSTPEGVVQNYVVALHKRDFEKAYTYVATLTNKPTFDQFRNAFLLGCVGAWSLHPVHIDIAKKVFSPPAEEVLWAKKVIAAMGDGTGAVMIDGKMQDDATWKQAKVVVDLARLVAAKDPEVAARYSL